MAPAQRVASERTRFPCCLAKTFPYIPQGAGCFSCEMNIRQVITALHMLSKVATPVRCTSGSITSLAKHISSLSKAILEPRPEHFLEYAWPRFRAGAIRLFRLMS